jgi:hypothetical protein
MAMPKCLEGKAVPIMQQPNHHKGAGRKPRVWNKWVRKNNLSRADAGLVLKNLLGRTIEELKSLTGTGSSGEPAYVIVAAKTIVASLERGFPSDLTRIMDAAFGRQPTAVELASMPPEIRAALEAIALSPPEGAG